MIPVTQGDSYTICNTDFLLVNALFNKTATYCIIYYSKRSHNTTPNLISFLLQIQSELFVRVMLKPCPSLECQFSGKFSSLAILREYKLTILMNFDLVIIFQWSSGPKLFEFSLGQGQWGSKYWKLFLSLKTIDRPALLPDSGPPEQPSRRMSVMTKSPVMEFCLRGY